MKFIQNFAATLIILKRSLISNNSRFDKYIRGELQLSPSELNGYAIFNTEKADCFHCHGTNLFTDNLFHNNGLDTDPFQDLGLGKITGEINDNGKFKTPTLRNIALTAPYMHDGRFQTLEEVIEHYDNGGHYSSTIDPLMKKLGIGLLLTNQEKQRKIKFWVLGFVGFCRISSEFHVQTAGPHLIKSELIGPNGRFVGPKC